MTVHSINKQALEQANLTQATPPKPASGATAAQALFTAALAQQQFQVGMAMPSAESAFKAKFDRPAPEHRPERPDVRPSNRAERRAAESAQRPERPMAAERPAPAQNRPAAARPEERQRTGAADAPADKPAEANTEAATAAQTNAAPTAGTPTDQPAEPVAVVIAAPTQVQTQTVQVSAASDATSLVQPGAQGGESSDADTDPFAFLDKEFGAAIKGLENQIDAGDDAADLDIDFADLLPESGTVAGTAARTASGQQQGAAHIAPAMADDLASQQADEMARMLAGTNANVKVAVKVDGPQQQGAAADPALAAADASMETQIAEAVTANASANGKGQNGQSGTQQGGQQNAGLANAAQQVAGNPAIANAQAAAQARPFAAQLAAQVDGVQAQSGTQQAGSAQPSGGMGTGAAQAASKPAPAQAPQAPHQPRHVDPKQVIDQVNVQIAKQAKGGADVIRVQLKPVDLGRIEIRLEVQDGRVTAQITADRPETLSILQKDARGLERALQDAGLKTDASSMNFSLNGDGQQAQNEARPQRRSRLARAAQGVENGGQPAAEAPATRTGGRGRVDIKV